MTSILTSAWFWLLIASLVILMIILLVGSGMKKIQGWVWFLFILAVILAVVGIVLASYAWYFKDQRHKAHVHEAVLNIPQAHHQYVPGKIVQHNPYVLPVNSVHASPVVGQSYIPIPPSPAVSYVAAPSAVPVAVPVVPLSVVNSAVPVVNSALQDSLINERVSLNVPQQTIPSQYVNNPPAQVALPLPTTTSQLSQASPRVVPSRVASNLAQAQRGFAASDLNLSSLGV